MKDDLASRAKRYATEAHGRINHRRKYTLDPYDIHLRGVADLVASVTGDPEMIAAAWLHDAVEDTPATFEDIGREFGPEVMRLVMELTDVSRPGDGNRAARKAMDLNHIRTASPRAKTVKLADIIDNTLDISRHDPRFARIYLGEMAAMLSVLTEGDPGLYARAVETVEACAKKLGMEVPSSPEGQQDMQGEHEGRFAMPAHISGQRSIRLFTEAFTARDVLEPLLSVDSVTSAGRILDRAIERRSAAIGLRRNGRVTAYVSVEDLRGEKAPPLRPIRHHQVVDMDASLADVIHVLTLFDVCFVALEGDVAGLVGREDIEKPVVRMWLFGMIMLVEMVAVELIRKHWPGGEWSLLLGAARLEKARQLQTERQRRKLAADLIDCLQFSDKISIVLQDRVFFDQTGFESMRAAKRVLKELETLRNNLAHGQEISRHDWPAIVRLTRRIASVAADEPPI
jgi:hypothetical protein